MGPIWVLWVSGCVYTLHCTSLHVPNLIQLLPKPVGTFSLLSESLISFPLSRLGLVYTRRLHCFNQWSEASVNLWSMMPLHGLSYLYNKISGLSPLSVSLWSLECPDCTDYVVQLPQLCDSLGFQLLAPVWRCLYPEDRLVKGTSIRI